MPIYQNVIWYGNRPKLYIKVKTIQLMYHDLTNGKLCKLMKQGPRLNFEIESAYTGAAVGRVQRVPVNPWISRTYAM